MGRELRETLLELEYVHMTRSKKDAIINSIIGKRRSFSWKVAMSLATAASGAAVFLFAGGTAPTTPVDKTSNVAATLTAFAAEEASLSEIESEYTDSEIDEAELEQLDQEINNMNVEEIQ